jgi:hypothetical protein
VVSEILAALTASAALTLLFLVAPNVEAQTAKLAGDWKGTSLCTVKNSPCHDETVVYHITEPDSSGAMTINADKIVNGKPDPMGQLDCKFDSRSYVVTCPMKHGEWRFTVAGRQMTGTLKLPDGTLYRNIAVRKSS